MYYWRTLLIALGVGLAAAPCAAQKIPITDEDMARIGQLIFANECGGEVEKLVWWNEGEEFPSLGIGHFIWYPKGVVGPFDESFPKLLRYLKGKGKALPAWLATLPGFDAPWNSRKEFSQDARSERVAQLRQFLVDTMPLQTQFIIDRFYRVLPGIMKAADPGRQAHIRQQFYRVAYTRMGLYPLVDYVNFKGEGVLESERYKGEGWGLLQVLEEMQGTARGPAALREFAEAAEVVLRRRVANAPPGRNEGRWMSGWMSRLGTYYTPE